LEEYLKEGLEEYLKEYQESSNGIQRVLSPEVMPENEYIFLFYYMAFKGFNKSQIKYLSLILHLDSNKSLFCKLISFSLFISESKLIFEPAYFRIVSRQIVCKTQDKVKYSNNGGT